MDSPIFHLDFLGNRMLVAITAIIHVLINHPLLAGASVLGGVGLIAAGPAAGHLCQRVFHRRPAAICRARQTPAVC